jgi:hypothetical protein
MIEFQYTDLAMVARHANAAVHLSSPNDQRWAGLCHVAPHAKLELEASSRLDIFLITGELSEQNRSHPAGSFLSRCGALSLVAGAAGAMFFVYRDKLVPRGADLTITDQERVWIEGGAHGMSVALLASTPHQSALVFWRPGTRLAFHTHPTGEEIFVLRGELRDERGAYPAGSWLRFHPGSGHAPYVEQASLILLRNGHLSA